VPKKKKFKSGVLPRSLSVARLALGGVVRTGWAKVRSVGLGEIAKADRVRNLFQTQGLILAKELSELKGSLMKVGQVLSFYGEQFLPPEFTDLLKVLQTKASPLDWETIEKTYRKSLGPDKWEELEIDREPVGAASLGQVHSAVVKATGQKLALKAQYPGVKKAIDSDLKVLRLLLKAGNWVPFTPALDRIFEEARVLLHQEVDYEMEFKLTEKYFQLFGADPRFIVPCPIARFSSAEVLATTFEEGVPLDSEEVLSLSQKRRDRLGASFFELFLKEVFEFHFLQTDPHFGNFRVRIDPKGLNDQIICFDFGAARPLSEEFLNRYTLLVKSLVARDLPRVREALIALDFFDEKGDSTQFQKLYELCEILMEPVMGEGEYDWKASDLASRSLAGSRYFIFQPNIRLPPTEMISLNRKAGGIYILMSKLGARFKPRPILDRYINR
jgi:predicted unusual protein kinase regulating ubiquinone biosynthesis (AarF/ABC1/UbiB family)